MENKIYMDNTNPYYYMIVLPQPNYIYKKNDVSYKTSNFRIGEIVACILHIVICHQ